MRERESSVPVKLHQVHDEMTHGLADAEQALDVEFTVYGNKKI